MAKSKATTLSELMTEVTEKEGSAAVYKMLAGYLRGRYLPRDSMGAQAKIALENGHVDEYVIEEVAEEIDDLVKGLTNAAKKLRSQEVAP